MFILEGNIGVGKSTFLSLLEQHSKSVNIVQEPLQNWASQDYGVSLLENFYNKPNRSAYAMETLAMIYRSREHLKVQENTTAQSVMERSIYSGHYCFAINGYQHGYFNNVEWDIYHQWVEFFFTQECRPPKGFIYLKAGRAVCKKRMDKLSRKSEDSVPLEYLEQIHNRHEDFLLDKKDVFSNLENVPVLTIDCNDEFETKSNRFKQHAKDVTEFIQEYWQ